MTSPLRSAGAAFLAALGLGPATAATPMVPQQHATMLIDKIPADMWPKQRLVRPDDYPAEQESLRSNVVAFLKGHFRVTGDRLFLIPPDKGIILSGGPFLLGGPSQLQEISSEPAFDQRPFVRPAPSAGDRAPGDFTLLTIGMTQSEPRIYTVIALHDIPNRRDELIGYFQLEPLVPDPSKGL